MSLREWWAMKRHGRMTRDVCEVCRKPLHEKQRVEVMVGDPLADLEYGGYTAVLVAYCKEHTP